MRAETYKSLREAVDERRTGEQAGNGRVGKKVVLGASFPGGKRQWSLRYQNGLEAFCATIYHNMEEHHMEAYFMEGSTILAPTNASVARINSYLMSKLPTKEVVLVSADSTVQPGDAARHPVELLNTLEPQGLPVHQLVLRPGCILRLMRNLNPKDGLCNGSRMRFIKVVDRKVGN